METLVEDKQVVLGLAGVARSGKDMFCKLAIDYLIEEHGLVATRYALADELKNDINPFLQEKCGIDIWNCTPEQKESARPLLLWYGNLKRVQTKGRYWVEKLGAKMRKDKYSDVQIVTDIRYGVEDVDEIHWLKQEMAGKLIHISQYEFNSFNERVFLQAPNDHESKNDPIMQKNADYKLAWEKTLSSDGVTIDEVALMERVKTVLKTFEPWT